MPIARRGLYFPGLGVCGLHRMWCDTRARERAGCQNKLHKMIGQAARMLHVCSRRTSCGPGRPRQDIADPRSPSARLASASVARSLQACDWHRCEQTSRMRQNRAARTSARQTCSGRRRTAAAVHSWDGPGRAAVTSSDGAERSENPERKTQTDGSQVQVTLLVYGFAPAEANRKAYTQSWVVGWGVVEPTLTLHFTSRTTPWLTRRIGRLTVRLCPILRLI